MAFTEFELGVAAAFLASTPVPGHTGFRIARHAKTEGVALAEQEHRTGQALARGYPEMGRRFGGNGGGVVPGVQEW